MYARLLLGLLLAVASGWHKDPQVAQGEWKIEIQVPPCDNSNNLQVIWPKENGGPITIECNAMTVGER